MKKIIACFQIFLITVSFLTFTPTNQLQASQYDDLKRKKEILSQVYHVDKIYKSMMGPHSTENVFLLETKEPEILWITGYKAVMKGRDGKKDMPQEFMCHSNLDYQTDQHRKEFAYGNYAHSRLFTLSQGQLDVQFPKGFGIPVLSTLPLFLTTQVLNLNHEEENFDVRHKVTIEFVREKDLDFKMTALYPSAAYGLKSLEDSKGYFGISEPSEEEHGPGCLIGEKAGTSDTYTDSMGRKYTGHWVVQPGREENRTLATNLMTLPYDTTLHYIAVHLHPFAESIELRDITTGKSLFKSKARNYKNKIGLDHVDYFTSKKGIPVYRSHQYEIVSVYNNTSDKEQDSMAVMYLYLHDKGYVGLDQPPRYKKSLILR